MAREVRCQVTDRQTHTTTTVTLAAHARRELVTNFCWSIITSNRCLLLHVSYCYTMPTRRFSGYTRTSSVYTKLSSGHSVTGLYHRMHVGKTGFVRTC